MEINSFAGRGVKVRDREFGTLTREMVKLYGISGSRAGPFLAIQGMKPESERFS
jgi:hypothetical protein